MYHHSFEDTGFDDLQDCLSSLVEWLEQIRSEWWASEGEEPLFPETCTLEEHAAESFRLLYCPPAQEAECGIEAGAWEATLRAYAEPAGWKAEGWQPL